MASFISSEARDREENTTRVGGREWRGEEEKRNMETFGLAMVGNDADV
jgi:protein LSM14